MKLTPAAWIYAAIGGAVVVFWTIGFISESAVSMPRKLAAPSIRTFASSGSSGSSGGWFSGFHGGK